METDFQVNTRVAAIGLIFSLTLSVAPGLSFEDGAHNIKASEFSMRELDARIAKNANDAYAYRERGQAYLSAGECDLAIADYNRCLKLAPKTARALVGRSQAYEMEGRHLLALADVDEVIASKDTSALADAYKNKITLLKSLKRYSETPEYYGKLLESKGLGVGQRDRFGLHEARADMYIAIGKPLLAIEDIKACEKDELCHYGKYVILGKAYRLLHKPEQELEAYSAGIARYESEKVKRQHFNRHLSELYQARADLYARIKKPGLAKADMQVLSKMHGGVYNDVYNAKGKLF